MLAVQTGLRVSEITGLRVADVHLDAGPHVRCTGKGRKDRATPLTRQTVAIMRGWLAERGDAGANPVFPGPDGKPLGTDAVRRRHPAARRHGSSPLPLSIEQENQPAYAKAHLRDEDAGKRH